MANKMMGQNGQNFLNLNLELNFPDFLRSGHKTNGDFRYGFDFNFWSLIAFIRIALNYKIE
jgi:hypothetical protein